MGLEQAIEEFTYKKEGLCPVGRLMDKLNDADKKALISALDKGIPSVTITNALRKEGYKIAEHSIGVHRKNICSCVNNK